MKGKHAQWRAFDCFPDGMGVGGKGLTAQLLTILKHLITLPLHNLLANEAISHTASILVIVCNNSVLNGIH